MVQAPQAFDDFIMYIDSVDEDGFDPKFYSVIAGISGGKLSVNVADVS